MNMNSQQSRPIVCSDSPGRHYGSIVLLLIALCSFLFGYAIGFAGDHKDVSAYTLLGTEKTVLHDSIVHYRYDLQVGPEEFDRIRVHRVVRERPNRRPVDTVDGLFMLPGAPNSFEMIFMSPLVSDTVEWDHSITSFLAKNDIDVWGMDYRWALVPPETTDFEFMQDWGLQRDIDDAETALQFAQKMRQSTGQGSGRLHLLGFSHGTRVAYSLVGEETQKPYGHRIVKGFVPVDFLSKTDDEAFKANACANADSAMNRLNAGIYYEDDGAFLKFVADLAEYNPDGASPIAPTLTNLQFLFLVVVSGDTWHFCGGTIDGLDYTDPQLLIDSIQAAPSFFPVRASYDATTIICDEIESPFDDHISEIAVPILYVGAAGGLGELGLYSLSLTGSEDITVHIVQLQPDELRMIDFGHADLFFSDDAETLAWRPILDWLVAHSSPKRR